MDKRPSGKISEIALDDEQTWRDRVFLSLDIDWAIDEVLDATIDMVEGADVAATWFVTHDTPLLARLRENPKFELGIHPNYNRFFSPDATVRDMGTVIDDLQRLVPEAVAVRTHSLVTSSPLLQRFASAGFTHDSNCFIPWSAGLDLRPWEDTFGLVRVPFSWADDVHMYMSWPERLADIAFPPGLRVFDFHPIHVFLNAECVSRYEDARPDHHNIHGLKKWINPGSGTQTRFLELLNSLD